MVSNTRAAPPLPPRFAPGQHATFKEHNGIWETYYSPQGRECHYVYKWLYDTFGTPSLEHRWDYHGGWIKIVNREDVDLFILRWL